MELNLGDLISRAVVAKMEDPAFVEKEVHSRLDKLITEAVDRALRSYGDAGKLIEQAVADALKVDRLDLPSYGHIVTQILKAQIEERVAELVAGRLSADMEELLSLAPKEVRLSEIAEAMITEGSHGVDFGPAITVIVEPSTAVDGYCTIYLDEQEHLSDREKHRCRHSLNVDKEGKVWGASLDRRDLKDTNQIGRSYGLAQRIRAYVACGTRLIIDEDAVVTGIGDY